MTPDPCRYDVRCSGENQVFIHEPRLPDFFFCVFSFWPYVDKFRRSTTLITSLFPTPYRA